MIYMVAAANQLPMSGVARNAGIGYYRSRSALGARIS